MTTANRPNSAAPQRSDFASDFLWGCATSSYQIEGAHWYRAFLEGDEFNQVHP